MADKTVNDPSPQWEEMELDRKFPRILLTTGQRGLREAGTDYLPRYEGEVGSAEDASSEYGSRVSRTFLVNFYKDAIKNLVGKVFAQPLQFTEDTPQEILDLWESIDDRGTHGDIFVERVCRDALGQGISHVMVDFPGAGDFENQVAEAQAGRRPRWVHYKAQPVIEALAVVQRGRPFLGRARIREAASEVEDYSYSSSQQVREYVMGDVEVPDLGAGSPFYAKWRIHTLGQDDQWTPGEWTALSPSGQAPPELKAMFVEPPLVAFDGESTGFFTGRPPLLNMSDLNHQHYILKSNIDNMEWTATVPTLLQEGGDSDANVEVGAHRLIWVPEGATLKWLEIVGSGVSHAKDSLRHLEEHIRLAGREPMIKKATGSELATVRLRDEVQHLTLAQSWAIGWVASVNRCLRFTGGWMGIANPGEVFIDQSVMEALERPDGFEDVKELSALGVIGRQKTIEEAKRYGVLDRDTDVQKTLDEVDGAEPPALTETAIVTPEE